MREKEEMEIRKRRRKTTHDKSLILNSRIIHTRRIHVKVKEKPTTHSLSVMLKGRKNKKKKSGKGSEKL